MVSSSQPLLFHL